jgi:hypothetical protein
MTKILIPLFTLIIFASCKKEFSESNDGDQPIEDSIPRAGRLIKRLAISGTNKSDTATIEYSYDITGNLELEITTMKVKLQNGTYDVKHFYTRYYREPVGGRIVKIARKGPYSDNGNNVDTLFDYVTYKSPTSSMVEHINNGARVYSYDAHERVSGTSEYMHWPNPTDPVRMVVYHIYTYDDNGNIKKREEFTDLDADGVFQLNFTYKFEYDNKINPLLLGDDALIEWNWTLFSPNNVLKQINDDANPAGIDDEITTVYEYGVDNLPRSGGYNLGPNPIILKFIYE